MLTEPSLVENEMEPPVFEAAPPLEFVSAVAVPPPALVSAGAVLVSDVAVAVFCDDEHAPSASASTKTSAVDLSRIGNLLAYLPQARPVIVTFLRWASAACPTTQSLLAAINRSTTSAGGGAVSALTAIVTTKLTA